MPEYYGLDAEEFERAKEIVRGDLDAEMTAVATCKTMLLQLEVFEQVARQSVLIADALERLERN